MYILGNLRCGMPAALRRTVGDRYIADTGPELQKGRI
jgi:hypothetical protein